MKTFFSYHFDDEPFVNRVDYYLHNQPRLKVYCYADQKRSGGWAKQIAQALDNCPVFVLFVGKSFGDIQHSEAEEAQAREVAHPLVVALPDPAGLPLNLRIFRDCDPIRLGGIEDRHAQMCAQQIVSRIGLVWADPYEIPVGYPFDYEKEIIEEYVAGQGRISQKYLGMGCADHWPAVEKMDGGEFKDNPVPEKDIGRYRREEEKVIVDVRSKYHCNEGRSKTCLMSFAPETLTFMEAGPRQKLRYPTNLHSLRVGVVTSGGIAPGINAVIAGIVERHVLYARKYAEKHPHGYELAVCGYRDGFQALLRPGHNYGLLDESRVEGLANQGGSILSTSRADELLDFGHPDQRSDGIDRMVQKLKDDGIEVLYVIGGDGSMKAAHALRVHARAKGVPLSVVGIPKTMDNDILWVWQSFGFLSAVEKAKEFILQLHTEAQSNPRLCIIQLFGSDSGFVVSHAVLASGVCDLALIPEVPFSMAVVSAYIRDKLQMRYKPGQGGQSPYGVIVMAETAIPTDVNSYLDDTEIGVKEIEKQAITSFCKSGRVYGQTPDALRTGGLKIVSRILQRDINQMNDPYWKQFRVFTNEPRHLLRSIPPSVSDVVFGQRLGTLAVDNAMAGFTDFMVSQWLTEFVLVPLKLVILGRKRVPKDGIFWKSVLASTGPQPADLTHSEGETI
ncbi:MAG: 6-phosphofructokinase [Candidatus Hydrogenedentes bacterium]|nr:6-phosphofructokinase [Candidatus Hydrogenedentota bacterium]